MELIHIIEKVKEMREAQKAYYALKVPGPGDTHAQEKLNRLVKARQLEKEVDNLLAGTGKVQDRLNQSSLNMPPNETI